MFSGLLTQNKLRNLQQLNKIDNNRAQNSALAYTGDVENIDSGRRLFRSNRLRIDNMKEE